MRNKKVLPVLLIGSLGFCLMLAVAHPGASSEGQKADGGAPEIGSHQALKRDLVSDSGEKVLEVVEASYRTTVAGLDSSSVRVRNLSGKNITALGLLWRISFTDGTGDEIEQLVNYRLHADIVRAKAISPFAPYEEKFIPRLTKETFEEGQAIKEVSVEFSFAEFEDGGGVGLEKSDTYKHLLSQRRGAELYKRWIERGYEDTPRGLAAVVERLSGDSLPGDPELKDDNVQRGALLYRQWMRDVLKGKGEDALREQMRRQLRGGAEAKDAPASLAPTERGRP
jgi:hypothetical protein